MNNNIEYNDNLKNNDEFITELVKQIALNEREISAKNQIIRDIYSSQSWKLVLKLERFFNKVAPPSSYRFQFSRWFFLSCLFIYHGFNNLFRKMDFLNQIPIINGSIKMNRSLEKSFRKI